MFEQHDVHDSSQPKAIRTMGLSRFEATRISKVVDAFIQKRRPPVHIRPELDIGFRLVGQSVEIFEIRPDRQQPEVTYEIPVARATFVKTTGIWKVFWQRADLKWHSYAPTPVVGSVEKFLELVQADPHCCFWG